jgi:hypothetical protein
MKVVGHQNPGNEFAGPVFKQAGTNLDKYCATGLLFEDLLSIKNISSTKVQSSGKILIGPFARHDPIESQKKERGQAALPDCKYETLQIFL